MRFRGPVSILARRAGKARCGTPSAFAVHPKQWDSHGGDGHMERNANDTFGSGNSGESNTGSFGADGGTGGTGTSDASFSRDTSTDASGLADRAMNVASTAGERLSDVGSQVRDRAGNLKNSLADALESSAEKLRNRGSGGGQVAGSATGGSAGMIAEDNRIAGATNQLAGGLQAS